MDLDLDHSESKTKQRPILSSDDCEIVEIQSSNASIPKPNRPIPKLKERGSHQKRKFVFDLLRDDDEGDCHLDLDLDIKAAEKKGLDLGITSFKSSTKVAEKKDLDFGTFSLTKSTKAAEKNAAKSIHSSSDIEIIQTANTLLQSTQFDSDGDDLSFLNRSAPSKPNPKKFMYSDPSSVIIIIQPKLIYTTL